MSLHVVGVKHAFPPLVQHQSAYEEALMEAPLQQPTIRPDNLLCRRCGRSPIRFDIVSGTVTVDVPLTLVLLNEQEIALTDVAVKMGLKKRIDFLPQFPLFIHFLKLYGKLGAEHVLKAPLLSC